MISTSCMTGTGFMKCMPMTCAGRFVPAASVVIELFGLGFGIFAITTVYPYIIDTFPDWSRSTVFLPTSLIILIVGLMSPVTGWLLDRYPIRWLFTVGIAVQGNAVIRLRRMHSRNQGLRMGGADVVVDIHTVGRATDGAHLRAEFAQHGGGDLVGRAVGCIHHQQGAFTGCQ